MQTEFKCESCGSPAIEFPALLQDDGPVKCQRCKTFICSVGEFRRWVNLNWQPGQADPVASPNDAGS